MLPSPSSGGILGAFRGTGLVVVDGASNDGRTAGVGIYRTDDGGLTWTAQDAPIGAAACCDPADQGLPLDRWRPELGQVVLRGRRGPPLGYQQSSQPRVAADGVLYVGYQQYLNSGQGCNAGVQNVLATSTDDGATFTHTVLDIVQGGACPTGQAGRGIFCIDPQNRSFRSRSHPIIGAA